MRIKRFFESLEDDFITLQGYFSGFNLLTDICGIRYEKKNENIFEILISYKGDCSTIIREPEDIFRLSFWIKQTGDEKVIMEHIEDSIKELLDDEVLDTFSIKRSNVGFDIKVTTKLRDGINIEDWIYISEDEDWLSHDKARFKALVKRKFDVDVKTSKLKEEWGKEDDRYLFFDIEFTNQLPKDKLDKISNWLKSTKLTINSYGKEQQIFTQIYSGRVPAPNAESNSIRCRISDEVNDITE